MYDSKTCEECVLNGECLWQNNNDVESCEDVRVGDIKRIKEKQNNKNLKK